MTSRGRWTSSDRSRHDRYLGDLPTDAGTARVGLDRGPARRRRDHIGHACRALGGRATAAGRSAKGRSDRAHRRGSRTVPNCLSFDDSSTASISRNSESGIRCSPAATLRMLSTSWRGSMSVSWVTWVGRAARSLSARKPSIAGVGGVLISDSARGLRLGREFMRRTEQSMRDCGRIEFGYLGCREQVASSPRGAAHDRGGYFDAGRSWHRLRLARVP